MQLRALDEELMYSIRLVGSVRGDEEQLQHVGLDPFDGRSVQLVEFVEEEVGQVAPQVAQGVEVLGGYAVSDAVHYLVHGEALLGRSGFGLEGL